MKISTNWSTISEEKNLKVSLSGVAINRRRLTVTLRSHTCNCKNGSDWLKRWMEAQHNIFKS